jgi:hypothetical protein
LADCVVIFQVRTRVAFVWPHERTKECEERLIPVRGGLNSCKLPYRRLLGRFSR